MADTSGGIVQVVASHGKGIGEQDLFTGDLSCVTRSRHGVRNVSWDLRLVYTNIRHLDGFETAPITLSAAVEYATRNIGVLPVSFAGARSILIAPGAVVASDPISLMMVPVTTFFVRTQISRPAGAAGWAYNMRTDVARGEGFLLSPASDYTNWGAGAISALDYFGYCPAAILGRTASDRPGIALCGDSIMYGSGSSGPTYRGLGEWALGEAWPYAKLAAPGDTTTNWLVNSYGGRRRLLEGCTIALCNWGINDIRTGADLATIQANLAIIWQELIDRGMAVYHCTITPNTSSTDAFATTENQTLISGPQNDIRLALNAWLRTVPAPLAGVFEIADTVESARDSGLWKVGHTDDGLHPNNTGYAATSAAIDTSLLTSIAADVAALIIV